MEIANVANRNSKIEIYGCWYSQVSWHIHKDKIHNFLWILEVHPVDDGGLFLADCIPWLVTSIGQLICKKIIN